MGQLSARLTDFELKLKEHERKFFEKNIKNDQNITKNMFEVPFVLWQSKAFQKSHNIEQDINIKFSLEYLSHAIADLCGVQSKAVDYSKSLFNKNFELSPRIILDSINYDLKFNQ